MPSMITPCRVRLLGTSILNLSFRLLKSVTFEAGLSSVSKQKLSDRDGTMLHCSGLIVRA